MIAKHFSWAGERCSDIECNNYSLKADSIKHLRNWINKETTEVQEISNDEWKHPVIYQSLGTYHQQFK